jgi:hypothetical protein
MSLYIFAGFQFKSQFFSRIDLEHAIVESIGDVQHELRAKHGRHLPELKYTVYDMGSGAKLTDEICQMVARADVCLFELSDKNPNVMFELGFAYCMAKPIIYLVNKNVDLKEMPSDITGTLYRRYDTAALKIVVAKEIKEKVTLAVEKRLASLSLLDVRDDLNIVCPELPEQYRIKYATRQSKDYLRKARFADSDSLFYLVKRIKTLYPSCEIAELLDKEISDDTLDQNLISLGGPGWNTLTARLLQAASVPLEYGDFSEPAHNFVIKNMKTGQEYRTVLGRAGEIISDIGVFIHIQHSHPDKRLYLINGIQTYGVLGMCKSLLQDGFRLENQQVVEAWRARTGASAYLILARIPIFQDSAAAVRFAEGDLFQLDALT